MVPRAKVLISNSPPSYQGFTPLPAGNGRAESSARRADGLRFGISILFLPIYLSCQTV